MKNLNNNPTKNYNQLTVNELLIYFIWPFGALLYSLKNFRLGFSKKLFWLFCIYYGIVFIYADPFSIGSADSARYAERLIIANKNAYNFEYVISSFYNPIDGFVDIYEPLVTWMVSLFTSNPAVLFALFAFVFGFFYSQNLWLLFERIDKKVSFAAFLFLLYFALLNPIWNINGVRMWTAAHIFIYGILQMHINKETKGYIWIIITPLVHFSFVFPLLVILFYRLIPKNLTVLYGFFLITGFITENNLSIIQSNLEILPEVFIPRVKSYTNEEYLLSLQARKLDYNWYIVWQGVISRTFILFITTYLYFNHSKWKDNSTKIPELFKYSLFFAGFANLAALVPSGGRFLTISNSLLLFCAITLFLSHESNIKTKFVSLFSVPVLLFLVIILIRTGMDYTGFLTFIGNIPVTFFVDEQTPVIDFIKNLF